MILWMVLHFYNPYVNLNEIGPMGSTFFMLFLPACLAIISSLTTKQWLMLFAILWSLPFSLYFVLTPGIFALFGITWITYLVSFLFMKLPKSKKVLE
ncbi:hypothetical protein ACFSTA_15425 [Ornithinibacillus salinisoli]|uniref:DUF2651 domain-containing protein n=1 Tax=Ornithinibacillus salinisoli TaxID=1848459 RepID=A0ABW4W127_9BACI